MLKRCAAQPGGGSSLCHCMADCARCYPAKDIARRCAYQHARDWPRRNELHHMIGSLLCGLTHVLGGFLCEVPSIIRHPLRFLRDARPPGVAVPRGLLPR
jgi:hypothetical protein